MTLDMTTAGTASFSPIALLGKVPMNTKAATHDLLG
jgi:hypothetical protein